MKGLIKKDLFIIKSNLKFILLMFLVFTIMAFQKEGDLSSLPSLTSVMLFLSTFSYDEYNKWDSYAITFPRGRKNIVKAKYLSTLILIVTSTLITTILSLGINYLNNNLNSGETLQTSLIVMSITVLLEAIMYPIIFKFGIEKARSFIFIGIFIFTSIISIFIFKAKITFSSELIIFLEKYLLIIAPIIVTVLLLISYYISQKIYLKKEF